MKVVSYVYNTLSRWARSIKKMQTKIDKIVILIALLGIVLQIIPELPTGIGDSFKFITLVLLVYLAPQFY